MQPCLVIITGNKREHWPFSNQDKFRTCGAFFLFTFNLALGSTFNIELIASTVTGGRRDDAKERIE